MLFFKSSSNRRNDIKRLLFIKIETEKVVKDHIACEEVFCEKQRGFAKLMEVEGNTLIAECTLAYIKSKEALIDNKKRELVSLRSEISDLINQI